MQTVRRLLLIPVMLLSCAAFRFAEGATAITGKVVDETGAPVADAIITIPPTQDRAVSDAAGVFRLDVAAPGQYPIQVEREGFFLLTQPNATLDPDVPLDIRLNHLRELAESVDVNYSAPTIDPERTSDTKTLNSQEILNLPYPANQDYRNALQLMPGALLDNAGQLHFNGGDTRQANYRLNGFDISDPASGGLTTRVNVDAVQALEWDASRFSAREGRGSAGTLDVKTETGDDRWRLGATNFIPGFGSRDGLHLDHWSPRVRFSGPLRKSRAWFSDAMDAFYTVSTINGLPSGQNRARSITGSNLMRVQWNVTPAHILTAAFLANLSDDNRNGLSFLNPAETTVNRRGSQFMGTLKDQWSFGGGLLELGFADTAGYLRSSPQGNTAYVITPLGSRGNYFSDQVAWTDRQEWLANDFMPPVRKFGSHQIEIGADVERSGLDQAIRRHEYSAVRPDDTIIRDVQFLGSPRQFIHDLAAYGYALDRWSPKENLVIEGGVRTQWDEYAGGEVAAPRLAAAWSPKLAAGTKFSAGWGIFHDAITLNMAALSQEQSSITTFYAPSGSVIGPPIRTGFVLRPQSLRLPRFSLTSFSAERKLPWGLFGRMNLISRDGSRGFSFEDVVVSPTQNTYVLDNVQRQHYRAAEFTVRRTFLSKYEWFASYTRSSAHANAVVNYSVENPLFSPQAAGPLLWDAPNRFQLWGWAPLIKTWFPHWLRPVVGDTDGQLLADFRSGYPFSAITEAGTIAGTPNSYRLPFYGTLNVALERRFPFRGYLWAWRVGVINALNRGNPNVVNNDIDSPAFLTYGRGQARAVNVRLRFLGRK